MLTLVSIRGSITFHCPNEIVHCTRSACFLVQEATDLTAAGPVKLNVDFETELI